MGASIIIIIVALFIIRMNDQNRNQEPAVEVSETSFVYSPLTSEPQPPSDS